MQITHTCQSCNTVMAVHEQHSYQEIKDCLRGLKALCDACRCGPGGGLLPPERKRGQENNHYAQRNH